MKFFSLAFLTLSLLVPTTSLNAQTYPDRPIKIIVPYGPGGVDIQMRMAQPYLERLLGQSLIVENRPGAGAAMGTTAVRNAAPDGYTLLFTGTSAISVVPQMRKVQYKVEDFVPIGNFTGTALGVFVRANAPFKTLSEMISYAKQNPGKINMGSSGIGTTTHMVAESLQLAAGIRFTHIPYTGQAQIIGGVLNGSTDLTIGIPGSFIAQVKAGNMRAIASTGTVRSEFLPDVPTLKEHGIDIVEETKFGLLAPKGVSPAIVTKLQTALKTVIQGKEFSEKMQANYVTAVYLDSERFADALRQENDYWFSMLKRPEFRSLVEN